MAERLNELTTEIIPKLFCEYKENIDAIYSLEEKLYSEREYEAWIANYKKRSALIRGAFEQNTMVSGVIDKYFSGELVLTDEIADALYEEYTSIDVSKHDDPFYAIHFATSLLNYYTAKNNLSKVIVLQTRLGWEYMSAYRIGYKEYAKKAYNCYIDILSHKDKYATLTNPKARRAIFVAYYNIICVISTFSEITFEKAFRFLDEMLEFYNSETVQKIDCENEEILRLIKKVKTDILISEKDIKNCSSSTQEKFCVLARTIYKEQCEEYGGEYNIPVITLLANYRALIMETRCSYSEAIEYLLAYYEIRRLKDLEEGKDYSTVNASDYDFAFQTFFPDTLIFTWLRDSRVSHEMQDREVKKLIAGKYAFFMKASKTSYTAYLNESFTDWCFKSLNLLDSKEQKEKALLDVVVSRQIQTFFHSHMVAELAKMLVEAAIKKDPMVFYRMYPGKTADDIRDKEDEIIDFITKCALIHDIGKTRITNVINMQTRKLFPEELELIRKHPGIGADSLDEDFDAYHDVILGHHKFFDGNEGYPIKYNSLNSRTKVCLDIIAICDSLDAATDYLGRNYAPKKTFDDVIHEFEMDSVSKYNAFLVNLIKEDKDLYNKIDELITRGRERKYFELVTKHLDIK